MERITRREFLKRAAVVAAGPLAAVVMSPPGQTETAVSSASQQSKFQKEQEGEEEGSKEYELTVEELKRLILRSKEGDWEATNYLLHCGESQWSSSADTRRFSHSWGDMATTPRQAAVIFVRHHQEEQLKLEQTANEEEVVIAEADGLCYP